MNKNSSIAGGTARRIRNDEANIWYASPKEASEPDYEEWIQKEKAWAASFDIPIENLFIFEQGGKFPEKMCFIEEDNKHILFAMPAIKICPDCKNIAVNLFQLAIAEAKLRKVNRLDTFLDDCNKPYETLKDAIFEVGFRLKKHKVLYRRSLDKLPERMIGKNIDYRSVNELGVETVKMLFIRSAGESPENTGDSFPLTAEEEFKQMWGSTHYRKDLWKVAFHEQKPAGLVFMNFIEEKTGSFVYIAVMPEFRGHGFGDIIFVDGLRMLQSMGATDYLDSTNVSNHRMIRIFENNGCEKIIKRMELVYQI